MRICRHLIALLLAGAYACAQASGKSAPDEAIYRALADADSALADTLSAQWVDAGKHDVADALAVRLDVLATRGTLSAPAGQALEDQIRTAAALHRDATALIDRLTLYRQIGKGEKPQAAARAMQLLAATKPGDASLDVAELHGVVGCSAQIDAQADTVEPNLAAAIAVWHKHAGVRARFREYQLQDCLGHANVRIGRESEAIAAYDRAVAIAAQTFGEDSALRLAADDEKAAELEQLGRIREELALRESTLERARRHYGDSRVPTAEAEAGLGACLQQLGDYAQSRVHYEAAEKILAQVADAPGNIRLRVLANFANVLQEIGDEEGAHLRYQAAYAMVLAKPGSERTQAIILTNTGNTEFHLGHYDAADADFRKAFALREGTDGKQSPGLAFALEGLASTALVQRRYAEAVEFFSRALALREPMTQKDHAVHVQLMSLRFGLAMAKWGTGDLDGAFTIAQDCADRVHELIGGIAANLPERQSLVLRQQVPPATALVVTLAALRGDRASLETAWRMVMRDRGLIARTEGRRLAEARALKDPALAADWQNWRAASAELAESWVKSDVSATQIESLRHDAELAERHFWDRLGSNPGGDQESTPSVAALAQALPKQAALVAMAEGVGSDPAWKLIAGHAPLPDQWFAFRLGADGALSLTRIGTIDSLSALARGWYAMLNRPTSDVAELKRRGTELRMALFDRLHVLDAPRQLFFVPDGELFRISLGALPVGDAYAVEKGIQVHTLSNEGELLSPAAAAPARILLAGAPAFASLEHAPSTRRQLCQSALSDGFAALPNAALELDSLHEVLAHEGARVELLSGERATKQNVIAALPGAGVIHLATHGFSLDQTCADNAETRSMSVAVDATAAPANDLQGLSGLAFTGAALDRAHEPVGVLSADEFASLDLSQAAWVVLSACDSGLGPIGRSEGVFGMRRAIRMAGARTVVMSLWEVDDASTAVLMQSLYRARFEQHSDVPASLAAAMKATLASRRAAGLSDHPYYWAAFIGEGGWR